MILNYIQHGRVSESVFRWFAPSNYEVSLDINMIIELHLHTRVS